MLCDKSVLKGNNTLRLINMKVKTYIIIISLLFLTACYPYYKETNKNGISKFKSGMSLLNLYKAPKGSYASDEKFVKNVDLIFLHDTISKRCFTSYELENLKKVFSKDTLFRKKYFSIRPFNKNTDLKECIGLFYIRFNFIIKEKYINVPLIKLQDTLFINGVSGIEIDEYTKDYIERCLLDRYDYLETEKQLDIFMRGSFKERVNKGQPVR